MLDEEERGRREMMAEEKDEDDNLLVYNDYSDNDYVEDFDNDGNN